MADDETTQELTRAILALQQELKNNKTLDPKELDKINSGLATAQKRLNSNTKATGENTKGYDDNTKGAQRFAVGAVAVAVNASRSIAALVT